MNSKIKINCVGINICMADNKKEQYLATATADMLYGEGQNNTNVDDIARLTSLVDDMPAGNADVMRAACDSIHGDNLDYEILATRAGCPHPKVFEFLRLKRQR